MTQPASEQLLVRAFGTTLLAAAIVNIIVGGGIFALPGRLAETLGSAAPFAFILGALLMVPVVLCFAAAGSRATATGGPYSYGRDAFGPFAGFSFGALTWISNVTGCAGVAAALVDQAARVWPAAGEGGMRSLLLVLLFALFAALNLRGVHIGARAIGVLAAAKLTPLVLLVLLGIWFIEPAQLTVPQWPAWEHWGQAMVLVLFAYAGMESALVPTGEVRDPGRTVPRAALAAILFVILLYVGLQLTAQGVLGAALAGDKAPLASTAGALWTPGFTLLLLGAGVSMLGYLHGNILGNSRLLYALGRDGLLLRLSVACTHARVCRTSRCWCTPSLPSRLPSAAISRPSRWFPVAPSVCSICSCASPPGICSAAVPAGTSSRCTCLAGR